VPRYNGGQYSVTGIADNLPVCTDRFPTIVWKIYLSQISGSQAQA
jgi:hypothetical protein